MKTELIMLGVLFLATVLLVSGVMIAIMMPPSAPLLATTVAAVTVIPAYFRA